MSLSVHPLTHSRIPDFYRLHAPQKGLGWCRCVAWWVPSWEGWGDRTQAQNAALREALFDEGQLDGYLLYKDGAPIGWCQVGQRDRLEKLRAAYDLPQNGDIWALSCLTIAPEHRGQGMARALLQGVLDQLQTREIGRVQAFPKASLPSGRRGPGEVWTGPLGLYLSAGFRPIGAGPRGPILELNLFQGVSP